MLTIFSYIRGIPKLLLTRGRNHILYESRSNGDLKSLKILKRVNEWQKFVFEYLRIFQDKEYFVK